MPAITFILVRPRNPKNIGASARAMANFGLRKLAVVDPYEPVWKETTAAVNAEPVIRMAKKYSTLDEALANCHVVIGTSSGSRRVKDKRWITPDGLSTLKNSLRKKRMAVLFGSEKTGLSNDDLNRCHHILSLPTDRKCPSLNLSHAVCVTAFLLHRQSPSSEKTPLPFHLAMKDRDRLLQHALNALKNAPLFAGWPREKIERELRSALTEWPISPLHAAILHGVFRWMEKNLN